MSGANPEQMQAAMAAGSVSPPTPAPTSTQASSAQQSNTLAAEKTPAAALTKVRT